MLRRKWEKFNKYLLIIWLKHQQASHYSSLHNLVCNLVGVKDTSKKNYNVENYKNYHCRRKVKNLLWDLARGKSSLTSGNTENCTVLSCCLIRILIEKQEFQ